MNRQAPRWGQCQLWTAFTTKKERNAILPTKGHTKETKQREEGKKNTRWNIKLNHQPKKRQRHRSFILGDSNGKIVQVGYPVDTPTDKKSNTNAYGRKGRERKRLYTNACGKERKNRQQMPMAMKERPNHKWWWQTKNGCPNQASKRKTAALIRQANEKWLP